MNNRRHQNTHYVRLRLNISCRIFKHFLAEVFSYRKVLLRSFSICLMKRVNSTNPKSPIKMAIKEFRYSSLTWQNQVLCTTILSANLWQRLQLSIHFDDSNFVSIYIALKHKYRLSGFRRAKCQINASLVTEKYSSNFTFGMILHIRSLRPSSIGLRIDRLSTDFHIYFVGKYAVCI